MVTSIIVLRFKCRIPRLDLQTLLVKIMLKSKWLDLVLDENIMTLTVLSFDLFFHVP